MANLHDLKRRITSVQKTKKITQALNMVAAAHFRKAQSAILNARPYEQNLKNMLCDIFNRSVTEVNHKYFINKDKGKTLLVVVAADKGLCGAFNTNIIRQANNYLLENKNCDLYLMGNKAVRYLGKHRAELVQVNKENIYDDFQYHHAVEYGDELINYFLEKDYREIVFIYNQFKSAITQNVISEKYLPVTTDVIEQCENKSEGVLTNYIFEPSQSRVLDKIVKHFLHYKVYRILIESYAAEQGARMTAMDAATENALEMIDTLQLKYNRERQSKITTELTEIIAGAGN